MRVVQEEWYRIFYSFHEAHKSKSALLKQTSFFENSSQYVVMNDTAFRAP